MEGREPKLPAVRSIAWLGLARCIEISSRIRTPQQRKEEPCESSLQSDYRPNPELRSVRRHDARRGERKTDCQNHTSDRGQPACRTPRGRLPRVKSRKDGDLYDNANRVADSEEHEGPKYSK